MEHISDECDIGYTITGNLCPDYGYAMYFEVYQIQGVCEDGQVLWIKKGAVSLPDPVESIDDAEIFLHGSIKWDGCSNWHFDEQDRIMIHGCSVDDMTNVGVLFERMCAIAKNTIPSWLDD